MKNLFKKKISPACEYCSIGKTLKNNSILCVKYGITNPKNHCKKFKYDPIKRIPKKQTENLSFDKKDFIL